MHFGKYINSKHVLLVINASLTSSKHAYLLVIRLLKKTLLLTSNTFFSIHNFVLW